LFSNSGSNEVDVSVNKDPETGQIYTVFSLMVTEKGRIGFRDLEFQGCRTTRTIPSDPCETNICQRFEGYSGLPCSEADCSPSCNPNSNAIEPYEDYAAMLNFMEGSLHPALDYDHFSLRFIVWRDVTDPDSYEVDPVTGTYSFKDDAYLWRMNLWNTDEVMESGYEDHHNIVCAYWIDLEDVVVEWSGGDEWTVTVDQCGLGESFGGVCPDSDYGHSGRYVIFWETYYQGILTPIGKSGKFTLDSEYRYVQGSGTAFKFVSTWTRIMGQ
jgi:hypothetical protein